MFSYTCTQSCCNLPNNPHNRKSIQSNALLVISIFMMLNKEGKRKYFRQVSTLLLYDMIFARSFDNNFVYYFGNLSNERQCLKQKHFVASAQGQRLCISIFALINNIISKNYVSLSMIYKMLWGILFNCYTVTIQNLIQEFTGVEIKTN